MSEHIVTGIEYRSTNPDCPAILLRGGNFEKIKRFLKNGGTLALIKPTSQDILSRGKETMPIDRRPVKDFCPNCGRFLDQYHSNCTTKAFAFAQQNRIDWLWRRLGEVSKENDDLLQSKNGVVVNGVRHREEDDEVLEK